MQTINDSFLSPSYLSDLDWVYAQFKIKNPVVLHISNATPGTGKIVGWTGREQPGRPILVKLGVDKHKFPYTTRHAGIETTVSNLREELVLVLAHELRHAHQIDRGVFGAMNGHWAELDAEREAVRVLERYRVK